MRERAIPRRRANSRQCPQEPDIEIETFVSNFVRIPPTAPPPNWNAHREATSFAAAVAQGLLFDVSHISQTYGLSTPVFLDRELEADIVFRLPGELNGLTATERRTVIVAQTTTLLSRSVNAIDNEEYFTFARALAEQKAVRFDLSLPLLADISTGRPRSQGTLVDVVQEVRHAFAAYTLYVSLENDQSENFGIVLALQTPFSPQHKSNNLY